MPTEKILLPGSHNIENFMAAITTVYHCVEPGVIEKTASSFRGVEHRIEPVRKVNEIRFYNDSIASSPNRTAAGLNSFREKVILIAGGKDKNSDYSQLGKVIIEKVKYMVLVGETSDKIEDSYMQEISKHENAKKIGIKRCFSMEEAVNEAFDFAEPGDVVILSPASTSFDLYKNFEERGNKFKEIVNRL